jgi:hypothetical protein
VEQPHVVQPHRWSMSFIANQHSFIKVLERAKTREKRGERREERGERRERREEKDERERETRETREIDE